MAKTRKSRPPTKTTFQKGMPKVPGSGMQKGQVTEAKRAEVDALIRKRELSAEIVVEMIARGALYDPGDYFQQADDPEYRYPEDGPEVVPRETTTDGAVLLEHYKGDVRPPRWRKGDFRPLHELTEAQRQSIAGIEVVMKNATAGDGKVDRILKLKLADRSKSVEMAAKYHALLTEKVQVSGDAELLAILDQGRARVAAEKAKR